jgi:hypothetical protein
MCKQYTAYQHTARTLWVKLFFSVFLNGPPEDETGILSIGLNGLGLKRNGGTWPQRASGGLWPQPEMLVRERCYAFAVQRSRRKRAQKQGTKRVGICKSNETEESHGRAASPGQRRRRILAGCKWLRRASGDGDLNRDSSRLGSRAGPAKKARRTPRRARPDSNGGRAPARDLLLPAERKLGTSLFVRQADPPTKRDRTPVDHLRKSLLLAAESVRNTLDFAGSGATLPRQGSNARAKHLRKKTETRRGWSDLHV